MEIILASKNVNKISEIRKISSESGFRGNLLCYPQINIPEVEESGKSFYDNAIIKAEKIYDIYRKPVISDDSGLCVDCLGGYPGIFSSRYSGGNSGSNIDKLLTELSGVPEKERTAYFTCVVCYYSSPEEIMLFSGKINGLIVDSLAGENGFGYDPVFFLPEYKLTMAQMSSEHKNRISHRSLAFRRFFNFLKYSESVQK